MLLRVIQSVNTNPGSQRVHYLAVDKIADCSNSLGRQDGSVGTAHSGMNSFGETFYIIIPDRKQTNSDPDGHTGLGHFHNQDDMCLTKAYARL